MQIFDSKQFGLRNLPTFWHVAYWFSIAFFFGLFWGSDEGYYSHFLISELILLPPKIVLTYWIIYFLLPRFLLTKQYVAFVSYSVLSIIFVAVVLRLEAYFILIPLYGQYDASQAVFSPYRIMQFAADSNTVFIIPLGYELFSQWYAKQLESRELAQQRTEAELQLLKNQLHPHFLFNSLNNLYSLVLKKSEEAPEMVLKLSALMRYQLYEANTKLIELDREIEYLQNYVSLEKIRYGNRFELNFTVHGETKEYKIAPLILLPFVENAFKHGVTGEMEQAWIRVELSLRDDQLVFIVENSKAPKQEEAVASGIGLKNVKRRLELLYPERHELSVNDDEAQFSVILKLEKRD